MEYSLEGYLTQDERARLAETEEWLEAKPSRFKKLMGLTGKPLQWAYDKTPESFKNSVSEAIFNVLCKMRDGAATTIDRRKVFDRIQQINGPLKGAGGLLKVPIGILEDVSKDSIKKAKASCAAEGALTGSAGLPGILVDIPALYALLFRLIQEVATCYGFPIKPEQEQAHILKVLDIGHHLENTAKRQGMKELQSIQDMIREGVPVRDLERFAVQKGLQAMARQLGIALTQRKAAQSVVLVGGVVGAGVNYQLATDIGEVAFHAYRRRFLLEVALARMTAG